MATRRRTWISRAASSIRENAGYDQLGPSGCRLPHVLMLRAGRNDQLWRKRPGGRHPFLGVVRFAPAFFSTPHAARGAVLVGCSGIARLLALNPNLLYLQATPMTETVVLGGADGAAVTSPCCFRETQSLAAVTGRAWRASPRRWRATRAGS